MAARGPGLDYPFAEPPAEGAAIEVAPGILWIRLPLPMRLDHVNVFALDEGDGWTVVDTGFDTRRGRAVWETILAGPLAGRPVKRVIATHYHPDHIGLAGWFQASGAELWTTRTSWLMARMLTLDVQERPVPETLGFWRAAGMDDGIYAERAVERPFNFSDCVAPLPLGYRRIAEGDIVAAGGRNWRVRIGNGHAPEHATLWSEDDDLILAGDQFLPSISPNISVFASEPLADPLADWLDSCTAFSAFAEERHLVLCGHKLPFHGLPIRLGQLIGNHEAALRRLEAFLSQPRRAGECFQPLFWREIGGGEYGMALGETIAHLNHLERQGRVRRRLSDAGVWFWERVAS